MQILRGRWVRGVAIGLLFVLAGAAVSGAWQPMVSSGSSGWSIILPVPEVTRTNTSPDWWTAGNAPDLHVTKVSSVLRPNQASTTNVTVNASNTGTWTINVSLWDAPVNGLTWTNTTIGSAPDASVTLADVDGDGDTDIVTGDYDNETIFWNRTNLSTNGWTPVTLGTVNESIKAVAAGDINGDGAMDVVTGDQNHSLVLWNQTNNSAHGWDRITIGTLQGAVVDVGIGDVEGDGDTDIVSTDTEQDVIWWNHTNSSAAGWENVAVGAAGGDAGKASEVELADFDRDGDLDILSGGTSVIDFSGFGSSSAFLYFWNNTGSGWTSTTLDSGFTSGQGTGGQIYYTGLEVGDLDGDDVMELLYTENGLNLQYTNTTGPIQTISSDGDSTPVLGDINHDNRMDLLAQASDTLQFWNNTDNTAAGFTNITAGTMADMDALAISDLDQDGDLDAVTDGAGGTLQTWTLDTGPNTFLGSTTLSVQDAAGSIATAAVTWTPTATDYRLVAVADPFRNYTSVFRGQDDTSAVGNRLAQSVTVPAPSDSTAPWDIFP